MRDGTMRLLDPSVLYITGNVLLMLSSSLMGSGLTLLLGSKFNMFGNHTTVYNLDDSEESQDDPDDVFQKRLADLEKTVEGMGEKLDAMDKKLDEVYYAPGIPGYEATQANFRRQFIATAKSV